MNDDTPTPSTLLLDVLEHWEESYRLGHDRTPKDLIPDRPEWHNLLEQRISRRKKLLRMLDSSTVPTADGRPNLMPQLPGYEMRREIGRGGMGVVYEAVQSGLGRAVAVKMLSGVGSDDRFRAEGQALASLRHPNIVQMFEVGEHNGEPYMVLELLRDSLADRLREGPLSAAESAALLSRLAKATAHAHEAGILHRDLKPGNVLLGDGDPDTGCAIRGRLSAPKVADFGLAKHYVGEQDQDRPSTGGPIGTPSYMAPEQIQHRRGEIGPAVDVWALGAILYECLTGRPPFQAADFFAVYELVTTQDPVSPRRLNPKVPRDLETVCLKCLRKDAADRYGSAAELAEDVDRFRAGRPVKARRTPPWVHAVKWAKRRPAVAALSFLSVAAVIAAFAVFAVYSANLSASREKEREARGEAERNLDVARDVTLRLGTNATTRFLQGDQTKLPPDTLALVDDTIAAYEQLAAILPDDIKVWETLGRLLFIRNRHDEEDATFRKAEGALRRALTLRRAALEKNPSEQRRAELANAAFNLGRALAARGYPVEAEPLFEEYVRLREELAGASPDDRERQLQLATAYLRTASYRAGPCGDPEAALRVGEPGLEIWESFIGANPSLPPQKKIPYFEGLAVTAGALAESENFEESLRAWDRVLTDPTLSERLKAKRRLHRAGVLTELDRHPEAADVAREVEAVAEREPDLYKDVAKLWGMIALAVEADDSLTIEKRQEAAAEHRERAARLLVKALEKDEQMTAKEWWEFRRMPAFRGVTFPEGTETPPEDTGRQ